MVVMYAFMVYVGFRFSVLAAVNTSNEVEIPEGELKEAFISRANGGSSWVRDYSMVSGLILLSVLRFTMR